MLAALVGAVVLVAILALTLLLRRRRVPDEGGRSGDMLGLEMPEPSRAPGPAVAVEPRLEPPAPVPAEPAPALDDPDVVRVHEKARRRARTVVREIMMYNAEKLEQGRREGNIIKFLGREIEMSRKLYQASIDLSDTDSARYFDESLLSILANGDPNLLREE
jgi:hypothetical protein